MAYYLRNAVKEVDENGNYCCKRTPEQIEEVRRKFGDIPEGDIFNLSMKSVLSWGKPWWRIFDVVFDRNARKDNLTDQDDFQAWKALLFTLASTLQEYTLPERMVGYTCHKQWREDMYNDAVSALYKLIHAARGKRIRIHHIVWAAITRAARDSRVHRVPDNFNHELFRLNWRQDHFEVDPASDAVYAMDREIHDQFIETAKKNAAKRIGLAAPDCDRKQLEEIYGRLAHDHFCRRYKEISEGRRLIQSGHA